MPLIEEEPPRSFPRGMGMRRWPVPSSGSDEYSQLAAGFSISLAKPTGIRDQGWLSSLTVTDFRTLTADFAHHNLKHQEEARRSAAEQRQHRVRNLIDQTGRGSRVPGVGV